MTTSPTLRRAIKAWLQAGWVFEGKRENSDVGTPQGGVISPLLANIALHGMENRITQLANSLKGDKSKNRISRCYLPNDIKVVLIDGLQLTNYAIDFNIGVSVVAEYQIKRLDLDYFESY